MMYYIHKILKYVFLKSKHKERKSMLTKVVDIEVSNQKQNKLSSLSSTTIL